MESIKETVRLSLYNTLKRFINETVGNEGTVLFDYKRLPNKKASTPDYSDEDRLNQMLMKALRVVRDIQSQRGYPVPYRVEHYVDIFKPKEASDSTTAYDDPALDQSNPRVTRPKGEANYPNSYKYAIYHKAAQDAIDDEYASAKAEYEEKVQEFGESAVPQKVVLRYRRVKLAKEHGGNNKADGLTIDKERLESAAEEFRKKRDALENAKRQPDYRDANMDYNSKYDNVRQEYLNAKLAYEQAAEMFRSGRLTPFVPSDKAILSILIDKYGINTQTAHAIITDAQTSTDEWDSPRGERAFITKNVIKSMVDIINEMKGSERIICRLLPDNDISLSFYYRKKIAGKLPVVGKEDPNCRETYIFGSMGLSEPYAKDGSIHSGEAEKHRMEYLQNANIPGVAPDSNPSAAAMDAFEKHMREKGF